MISIKKFTYWTRILIRYLRISKLNYFQNRIDWFSNFFISFFDLASLALFWYSLLKLGIHVIGWKDEKLLLFISLTVCSDGIAKIMFGFRDFEFLILDASFDKYLLRPLPIIASVLLEKINLFSILFKIITGLSLFVFSIQSLNITRPVLGFLCLIISTLILEIFYGCFTLLSFWFGKIFAARELVFSFKQAKKYPIDIFPKSIVRIFTYVIPLAFVATIPTKIMLQEISHPYYNLLLLIMMLFFSSVLFSFILSKGLQKYQSTGS